MTDLPFLLRLVDDPSPRVASKVAERLLAYGPQIWHEIETQQVSLSNSQRLALETLFVFPAPIRDEDATARLWHEWGELGAIPGEVSYLERALFALASWQNGSDASERGAHLLDRLATEFRAFGDAHDALALAQFLFDFCGLRGAPPSEFYEPRNSNLLFVLEEGSGLPISLSCIFILVGARIGLRIEGCNFPGHFLARDGRLQRVFDPYNRGRMLSPREVATLEKAAPDEMNTPATAREIIARVLRNLSVAYHHNADGEASGLMLSLLRAMDGD
ncbi:hypothetical protein IAD21_02321 [Abditibacteriota bacterium]|nr:hypothetical protein IAD21_02321 [Abditibacteriota bacterium]